MSDWKFGDVFRDPDDGEVLMLLTNKEDGGIMDTETVEYWECVQLRRPGTLLDKDTHGPTGRVITDRWELVDG